jgi:hypothetical protein
LKSQIREYDILGHNKMNFVVLPIPSSLGLFSSFARSWYQLENVVFGTEEVDLLGQENMIFSQNKATFGLIQGHVG